MAKLSDIIEEFIKELIDESTQRELEIQRNELANKFSCAPSQINYVLTTRFTKERGYFIESRRGGGGCIRIRQIEMNEGDTLLSQICDKIGNSITYDMGCRLIDIINESNMITLRETNIMKISINDRTLMSVTEGRNELRASILKSMIMIIML